MLVENRCLAVLRNLRSFLFFKATLESCMIMDYCLFMEIDTHDRPKRLTMVLRTDLTARVYRIAPQLSQNSNSFVNLCVEGCLNAMEDGDIHFEIPLVDLYRLLSKRTLLESKVVTKLCSLFAPDTRENTDHYYRFMAEALNEHEGPLTPEVLKHLTQKAIEKNKDRIEMEKKTSKPKTKLSKV